MSFFSFFFLEVPTQWAQDVHRTSPGRLLVPVYFRRPEDVKMGPDLDFILRDVQSKILTERLPLIFIILTIVRNSFFIEKLFLQLVLCILRISHHFLTLTYVFTLVSKKRAISKTTNILVTTQQKIDGGIYET